jgi:UDP-glucose 4-epimerase
MRALIVGGSGRIGRMVRRAWAQTLAPGTEVVFQTRSPAAGSQDLLWDPLGGDTSALKAAEPFDAMLVLSGVVPKPGAQFSLNSDIGLACGAAAAAYGIRRVLLASTSAVYGAALARAFSENDTCTPANDYGRAKLKMEAACLAQAQTTGTELCCLRIGNVAGADVLLINGRALKGDARLQLDRFGDGGTPLRSYIGPATLARVLAHLMLHDAPLDPLLNIAVPVPVTMGDLATAAAIPFDLQPAPATAHQNITLECARLSAIYPFSPEDGHPSVIVDQWHQLRDPP